MAWGQRMAWPHCGKRMAGWPPPEATSWRQKDASSRRCTTVTSFPSAPGHRFPPPSRRDVARAYPGGLRSPPRAGGQPAGTAMGSEAAPPASSDPDRPGGGIHIPALAACALATQVAFTSPSAREHALLTLRWRRAAAGARSLWARGCSFDDELRKLAQQTPAC